MHAHRKLHNVNMEREDSYLQTKNKASEETKPEDTLILEFYHLEPWKQQQKTQLLLFKPSSQ